MSIDSETTAAVGDRTYNPDDGILVTRDLTKHFGGLVAVDSLSIAVQSGEILGFIGPNGAGKSTTFNCITGMYPPTSGTIWFKGEDVTDEPPYRMVDRGMARTFQSFAPLEDRTIRENVKLPLLSDNLLQFRKSSESSESEAEAICRRVGLGNDLNKFPGELPHAGLIKLELAKAIATDPDLMLVDEAFAGLTANEVQEVANVLESLRNSGMTFIVVDHNMRGLLELIDRAVVIQFGSKIAEGTPEEIKHDEKVKQAYLGGE